MRTTPPMPLPVKRALAKLGADIKAARVRRRITTTLMAERVFVARSTLQKVEQGDPGVSLGVYATVLFILGLSDRIADLADIGTDSVGLQLDEERLPKRVRISKRRSSGRPWSDRELLVYVDLAGVAHFVGRLWARRARNRESATFEYDTGWLANPARFALEPALMLGGGPQHTRQGRTLFGAFGDSAPDRWGRNLIQRDERRRARAEARAPRSLGEGRFPVGRW